MPLFYWGMLVLIVLSLIYILTAPGNSVRMEKEIVARDFGEFVGMNPVEKLVMGFLETSHYYLAGGYWRNNHVLGVLSAICVWAMWKKRRPVGIAVSFVPLVAHGAFTYLFPWLLYDRQIPRWRNLFAVFCDNRYLPEMSYFSTALVVLQLFVYLMVWVCAAWTVFLLHGWRVETLLELAILAVGFAARLIIGFSPTIYISERTTLYTTVAILIVCLRNLLGTVCREELSKI